MKAASVKTGIALATLALQSARKLLQKGNLENKCMILTLSGADIRTSLVLIPKHIGDRFFPGYFLQN